MRAARVARRPPPPLCSPAPFCTGGVSGRRSRFASLPRACGALAPGAPAPTGTITPCVAKSPAAAHRRAIPHLGNADSSREAINVEPALIGRPSARTTTTSPERPQRALPDRAPDPTRHLRYADGPVQHPRALRAAPGSCATRRRASRRAARGAHSARRLRHRCLAHLRPEAPVRGRQDARDRGHVSGSGRGWQGWQQGAAFDPARTAHSRKGPLHGAAHGCSRGPPPAAGAGQPVTPRTSRRRPQVLGCALARLLCAGPLRWHAAAHNLKCTPPPCTPMPAAQQEQV